MTVTFVTKPAIAVGPLALTALDKTETPSCGKTPNEQTTAPKARNDLLPSFTVGMISLDTLVSAKNPVRKVSKWHVARVVRSIQKIGFFDPPILGKNLEIIDGHVRVEAARQLDLKEVPCVIADNLSADDVRMLRIALNRIQERGEWDEQALKLEFAYMLEFEADLSVTGFDPPEIDRILILEDGDIGDKNPLDHIQTLPSPSASAVSRTGDLWILGRNRVLCGNARSAADVEAVTNGLPISAVFTDHPYNVSVNGHVRVNSGQFEEFAEASGEMSDAGYEDFLRITIGNMTAVLKPRGILFVCIDWRHVEVMARALRTLGLELINLCVWGKEKPGMGSLYRSQHELVLVAKRPGASHLNNVQLGSFGRNRSNLWRYAGATGGRKSTEDDFSLHPTVKPVHLVRDAILDVTAIGDVVLDPFLGSGTTVLAAELSHRICVAVEISPAYVDVAVARWERLTGLQAMHAQSGLSFAQMRSQRELSNQADVADSLSQSVQHDSRRPPQPFSYEDF